MQLYKRRDFGLIFSDTIGFLKINGKHYFKLFGTLMGLPLIIYAVIIYFFFRLNMDALGDYANPYGMIDVDSNFGTSFLISLSIFLIVSLFFQILFFSFTPIYMILYNEYGKNFDAKDMLATFKSRLVKILKFSLVFMLTMIVISIPIIVLSVILAITLIGLLFLPILYGFIYAWLHNAFMEYISTTSKSMESIQTAFNMTRFSFWKSAGNLGIFYVILYIVNSLIVGIPYYIYIFTTMMSKGLENNPLETSTGPMILMYVASMILQLLANLIIQVNASIIYYTLIEEQHNFTSHDEIDQIGQ